MNSQRTARFPFYIVLGTGAPLVTNHAGVYQKKKIAKRGSSGAEKKGGQFEEEGPVHVAVDGVKFYRACCDFLGRFRALDYCLALWLAVASLCRYLLNTKQ